MRRKVINGYDMRVEERGQLSLLFRLLLLRFFTILTTLVVLDILVVDSQGLVDLGLKSRVVLNPDEMLVHYFMKG